HRSPRSTLFPYTTLFRSSTEIGLDDLPDNVRWPRRGLRRPLSCRPPSRLAVYDILALGVPRRAVLSAPAAPVPVSFQVHKFVSEDRKSTRLNSSHLGISY